MIVSKKISFDAAHYLPNYPGKCKNIHGHHWVVELGVEGPVGEDGMVADFKWLKDALEAICGKFDHTCLNDLGLSFSSNPTAENIIRYIEEKFLYEWIQGPGEDVRLEFIRVWETEDSMAELKKTRGLR